MQEANEKLLHKLCGQEPRAAQRAPRVVGGALAFAGKRPQGIGDLVRNRLQAVSGRTSWCSEDCHGCHGLLA